MTAAVTHAGAAALGAGAALVLFLALVVGVWAILQARARTKAVAHLDTCLEEQVGADPAARGEFLYRSLAAIATVDYEKHATVRQKAAAAIRKVDGG